MIYFFLPSLLIISQLWHDVRGQPEVRPAIRVRLNRPVFDQASQIVAGLVEYEVPRVSIPRTRQCFTEGCVEAHSFRMTSFRQPSSVAFEPALPNKFRIRVTDFDFMVMGQLSGSVQVIINIPVMGNVIITGRQISVSALMDLQKTVDDQPYLRFVECRIDDGIVEAKLANMGLLTDTINNKYRPAMSLQSRMQLEEAICENMNRLTQLHFSTRLARIPRSISAKEILDIVISNNLEPAPPLHPTPVLLNGNNLAYRRRTARKRLHKRAASDDYYDDIEKTEGPSPSKSATPNTSRQKITLTRNDVNNFFNLDRLAHVMVDTTLMDAASTSHDFSLGIAGNAFSTRSHGVSPYSVPHPFRLPHNEKRKMVEVVVSEYTINSLFYQAHRTNSLLFHVDSKTPGVGGLLKTTCTADEVCISDEVDRIGKVHPNRRLELIIRTTQPPKIALSSDTLTLSLAGRCIFFLEGTRQKVGVIPFTAVVNMRIHMVEPKLKVDVKIQSLEFANGIDFLGLNADDLDGLRKTTKKALETMINGATNDGFQLSTANLKTPIRLSSPHISVLPGSILLQADVDLYKTLYAKN
ncbi:unnamed protein product [Caenorhabditis auriculariae]|uniref:Lipid-binding serum glycoprotein C-terminal domain-containing protein n=1 Tax=Caenorhabditis auriculariae TaxID=2777116 RepID=A0A8S1HEF0_9PELO|nr:unnamed protein product [Caenorhabditis auriculariae]